MLPSVLVRLNFLVNFLAAAVGMAAFHAAHAVAGLCLEEDDSTVLSSDVGGCIASAIVATSIMHAPA